MKQHFVPEFLLKRWATNDGRVVRYTEPIEGKLVAREVFPSAAGFERDLYTLHGSDEGVGVSYAIEENFFQMVDHEASLALRDILGDAPVELNDRTRFAWARFLCSILHRVPQSLDMWRQKWSSTQLSDGTYYTPGEAEELAKANLPFFIDNEKIISFIMEMDWKIYDTSISQYSLLISEQPVVITNGLKTKSGHLAMPISPTKFFLAVSPGSDILAQIKGLHPKDLVRSLNRQICERARFFVVAADQKQDRFIRNRFGRLRDEPVQTIFGYRTE